jgi:hypothetical protein
MDTVLMSILFQVPNNQPNIDTFKAPRKDSKGLTFEQAVSMSTMECCPCCGQSLPKGTVLSPTYMNSRMELQSSTPYARDSNQQTIQPDSTKRTIKEEK